MREPETGFRSIAAEGLLLAAGGRAILLQLAEPSVGRGVAEHSDFESRPLDRLHATLTYAYAVVFGSDEESRFVRNEVNHAHGPVHAETGDDHPYTAFDPELQLWVAATLYESAISTYERVFGALETSVAERVYRQYAVLGTALQVPPEYWPATRAEFARYWRSREDDLTVSESARAVADRLLHPSSGTPRWLRFSMPLVRLVTAGLLPGRLRAEYGLRWRPRDVRRFERIMRVTAALYPRLPKAFRHLPRDRYLSRLRRQIALRDH